MNATLVVLFFVFGAQPRRVTDDQGCTKGIDAQNELDGEIVCKHPDGKTKKYEGTYAHGKRVGVAKTWWEDGKLASVDRFVAGKKHGMCESYRRDGSLEEACEYKADVKDGPCKQYGPGGVLRKESTYVAGNERGAWVDYHSTGKVRERGTLDADGRRDGLLERFRADGSPEEASTWSHGKQDGPEREWHPNGKPRLEAMWKGGARHGLAKRFHENGQLSDQQCYQNGTMTRGLAPCTGATGAEVLTRFFPDGTPYESETVQDGKRNGERKVFARGGALEASEQYTADQLDGVQKLFKNGKLERTVTWKAGRKHGLETVYFEDGKRSEETTWADDRRTGVTAWWMNGKKKSAELLDGELWRRQRWFDNGQLESEDTVRETSRGWSPQREGVEKQYTEAGVLVIEARWKAGKKHGTQKTFFGPSGKPQSLEEWTDGVRLSMKEWDEAGAVVRDERYNADGSRK